MQAELVGVIGGSGVYSLLHDAEEHLPDTPFGLPSGPVTTGTLAGRRVAFVARHGTGHRYPPHLVPYRANLSALRSMGARQVLSMSAVGSLRADHPTGTLPWTLTATDTQGRTGTFTPVGQASGAAVLTIAQKGPAPAK